MILSHKYKFIFIKTRKTAGTSLEVYLAQHCAPRDIITPIQPPVSSHVPQNHRGFWNFSREISICGWRGLPAILKDAARAKRFYNHIPAERAQARISKKVWDSYFKFCVERNPWDKTLSHYHHVNGRAGGQITFDDYIRRDDFCLNYPCYVNKSGDTLVDRVVKYESLTDDLKDVFRTLGVPFDGALSVRAKSEHRVNKIPYQEVYSERQRHAVEQAFAKEIEIHGYSF